VIAKKIVLLSSLWPALIYSLYVAFKTECSAMIRRGRRLRTVQANRGFERIFCGLNIIICSYGHLWMFRCEAFVVRMLWFLSYAFGSIIFVYANVLWGRGACCAYISIWEVYGWTTNALRFAIISCFKIFMELFCFAKELLCSGLIMVKRLKRILLKWFKMLKTDISGGVSQVFKQMICSLLLQISIHWSIDNRNQKSDESALTEVFLLRLCQSVLECLQSLKNDISLSGNQLVMILLCFVLFALSHLLYEAFEQPFVVFVWLVWFFVLVHLIRPD
jgi:hypothetical protein